MAGSPLELIMFLGGVILISLSGVLMPGPVLAITLAKSPEDRWAGLKVVLGHGIVEYPLMALIGLGFATALASSDVMAAIGLLGGAALVIMGLLMVRPVLGKRAKHSDVVSVEKESTLTSEQMKRYLGSPVMGGLLTTLNPYFFVWWATVGAVLIATALTFGVAGLVVFAVVHWSCDLAWYTAIGLVTHRSREKWTPKVSRLVFALIGILLAAFGVYFMMAAF